VLSVRFNVLMMLCQHELERAAANMYSKETQKISATSSN